jgi:hypothetical protein
MRCGVWVWCGGGQITRLLFLSSRATDALDQFNTHLLSYKQYIGLPKLVFAHCAWMALQ